MDFFSLAEMYLWYPLLDAPCIKPKIAVIESIFKITGHLDFRDSKGEISHALEYKSIAKNAIIVMIPSLNRIQ